MKQIESSDFSRENFNNMSESDVECSSFSAEHQDEVNLPEPMQILSAVELNVSDLKKNINPGLILINRSDEAKSQKRTYAGTHVRANS